MNAYALVFSTAVSFCFLVAVFRPLELVFPAKRGQKFFRPAWFTDLCFFLGQYLLWGGWVFWLLLRFDKCLGPLVPAGFRQSVAAQPWWAQAVAVIRPSACLVYWGHRLHR